MMLIIKSLGHYTTETDFLFDALKERADSQIIMLPQQLLPE